MSSFPTMFKKLYEATFNDLTPSTIAYLETGLFPNQSINNVSK